jgi:hypothetical protein
MTPRRSQRDPVADQGRAVKTTIELPEQVWRAAKIRALDDYADLRTVVVAALTAYLHLDAPGVQNG